MVSEPIGINKKGNHICFGGGQATENYEVTPGWRDCRTVPNLSRLLLSVIHPSASVSLFFCLGQCYTLLGSRSSPTLVVSLALLLLSPNDPVSPSSVTVQQYSVHPKESLPLPFLGFCLPILTRPLLLLLLPTPSFSIHILEDIYERETERVCICTIFRCRWNLHFLLEPSPVPLLFLI